MMEYQELKQAKSLFMVKQDIFNGEYILTDHTFNYGKLVYDGLGREQGIAYTSDSNWKFGYDFEPFGKSEILVYDSFDHLIGKIVLNRNSGSAKLIMQEGFTAKFENSFIFSNEYQWTCEEYGPLLRFKIHSFSLTDDIDILNDSISSQLTILLCFLATHIIIRKKRHSSTNSQF